MAEKIARLSNEVINRIAAGEVIEQPASIVKELVENSLDAGAESIHIRVEKGGENLISVEDDGCGMGFEDAILSLQRHATSKIRKEEDLQTLATMGFRGEALAAISAVSMFEMKTSEGGIGTWVVGAGGTIEKTEPIARNRGTTIVVRDLFFNTPARKKFLKSTGSNQAQISRVVETIILAHPEIAFSLTADEKKLLEVFPESLEKRLERFLPFLTQKVEGDGLFGFIGSPEKAKKHRREQILFINKRPLFSPIISRAVKMGYGTRVTVDAHPSFVFFWEVSPETIDVNVHPQKKEVRFSDEKRVFQLFERKVAASFEKEIFSFSEPLTFSSPSFTLQETPSTAFALQETPLTFDFIPKGRALALVDRYLFIDREELLLVDLQAAYARVLYESLEQGKAAQQALMWPLEVSIEEEEMIGMLQEMGIECRLIGKKTLAIDTLPASLEIDDFPEFLLALQEGKKLDFAAVEVARTSKKKFTIEQGFSLWLELLKCKDSLFCPIGRRIWSPIKKEKLERLLEEIR